MPPLDPAATPHPASTCVNGSTSEADVALYYGFIEAVLYRGVSDVAERFLAADFVEHGPTSDRSGSEFVAYLAARRAHFPDALWTIELLAEVSSFVVCHATIRCLERSTPPVWGCETTVVRIAAGRIAECWRTCDLRPRQMPSLD